MLYSATQIIATELALRGCPLAVVYGPERFVDVGLTDARIVIERSRSAGGEAVFPPHAGKNNPPRRAEREIAAVARVYGHSTVDGARVQDHEAVADQAVDLLIVALQITAARLVTGVAIGNGGYLDAESLDMAGLETWPGVVYELRFSLRRGVYDRSWAGAGKPVDATITQKVTGTCVSTAVPT